MDKEFFDRLKRANVGDPNPITTPGGSAKVRFANNLGDAILELLDRVEKLEAREGDKKAVD